MAADNPPPSPPPLPCSPPPPHNTADISDTLLAMAADLKNPELLYSWINRNAPESLPTDKRLKRRLVDDIDGCNRVALSHPFGPSPGQETPRATSVTSKRPLLSPDTAVTTSFFPGSTRAPLSDFNNPFAVHNLAPSSSTVPDILCPGSHPPEILAKGPHPPPPPNQETPPWATSVTSKRPPLSPDTAVTTSFFPGSTRAPLPDFNNPFAVHNLAPSSSTVPDITSTGNLGEGATPTPFPNPRNATMGQLFLGYHATSVAGHGWAIFHHKVIEGH